MSFDKAKAMRNAERFLAQGKIRAAINEYQRVIESDRTDFSTLNMLGDLHAKASEPEEAVACFNQVADYYSKQGFSQKAIAIYNKISRLKPDSIEVSAKLAQLYQAKGSVAEARVHFTTMAEQYARKGNKTEALNIWKQIAGLDPNNIDIYFKIADVCWQDQQKDEAAKAYIEAGKRLNIKKQYESAVTAFSRALEIMPDQLSALKGFVEAQVRLGYADEAAKSLEGSIARQPHNRELIFLLMDCYLDMGNLFEAEKVVTKLVEQEPSNYPRLLDLVQAYLKNSDLESATRILSIASEHLLVGGKALTLESVINDILSKNPEQLDAIRLLVRLHSWQRDEGAIKTSLEKLAEVAKLKGSFEDERNALEQLIMIAPQNAYFAQRLQELNLATGFSQGYYPTPGSGSGSDDIPTFESFTGLTQEDEAVSQTEAVMHDYGGSLDYTNGNGSVNLPDEPQTQMIGVENIVETESHDADFDDADEIVEKGDLSEFDLHNLQKELEGIDFYITQGFTDLAEKTLSELEERFGQHPEIEKVRQSFSSPGPAALNEIESGSAAETATDESEKMAGVVEADETLTEPADQFEDSVQSSETDEAEPETHEAEPETYETEPDPVQSSAADTKTEEDSGEPETNAAESESLQPESFATETAASSENDHSEPDRVENVPDEFEIPETNADSHLSHSHVEHISVGRPPVDPVPKISNTSSYEEFKSEIAMNENLEIHDDDFETSYQTGMAYKEMGLVEDAIREFQEAVKLVSATDGTRRFYWCCNLLGHCFMEKGMPNIALMWFRRALEAKSLTEEESQGLRYELANAYEKGGDKQTAIRYFEEIYAFDVDYRDVGKRLEALMSA